MARIETRLSEVLASPEAASAFLAVRVLVTPELTPLPRRRRVPPTVLLGPVLGGVCALGMLLLGLRAVLRKSRLRGLSLRKAVPVGYRISPPSWAIRERDRS